MNAEEFLAFLAGVALCALIIVWACSLPVNAQEVVKSTIEQHVTVDSSGGLFIKSQKKDDTKDSSCQGITIQKSGGLIIINQRVSDKDVLDVVDKE